MHTLLKWFNLMNSQTEEDSYIAQIRAIYLNWLKGI